MSGKTEVSVSLNDNQRKAVNFSYQSPAVVTAAAGSGKTLLLVERVVRLLSDRTLDIKTDSMVIMTFTRNATKSLREKLNSRLKAELEKCAENNDKEAYDHISEQIFLLKQAYISTIDSFCLRIIRENPEAFDLPLNFTMATLTKKISMQLKAMDMAMKDFYNSFPDEDRRALFYTFNFENDSELQKSIMSVEKSLSSYIDADKWLDEATDVYGSIEKYEACYIGEMKRRFPSFFAEINDALTDYDTILAEIESEAEQLIEEAYKTDLDKKATAKGKASVPTVEDRTKKFKDGTLDPISRYIAADKVRFKTLSDGYGEFAAQPTLASFNKMIEAFFAASKIKKVPALSGRPKGMETTKEFTKTKNVLGGIADDILKISTSECSPEVFSNLQAAVGAFIKLIRLYRAYYSEIKTSSGCLDFSDCELKLLNALSNDAFREQLSGRFKCVIVDEFQDCNDIQAEIFKKIGGNNLFYVGDVKQSIYAFRGGNPKIMAKLCDNEDGFTALPLNQNYRSRAEVLNTANAAFSGLMTREYGGVDYSSPENILISGAQMPQVSDPEKYYSEIIFIKDDESADKEMVQPRAVAKKIKELLDDKTFFVTKDGSLVPPSYSDFTILARSVKRAPLYRAALAELGIPTSAPRGQNFFDTEEIGLILDYLTVVDNPRRDEEALRILMSPIYRMSAEEMSLIRLGLLGIDLNSIDDQTKQAVINSARGHSLFSCVRICAKEKYFIQCNDDSDEETELPRKIDPKLKSFYEDVTKFRCFMCTNSIYKLVCKICEDTDLLSTVAAFSDSELRVANVRQFQNMAAEFESHDSGSLNDFLHYIEYARSLKDNKIEEARPPEDSDSVKIMTFHSSKGLEFPVCIMCELEKAMSDDDFTGTLLINREKYLALRSVDPKKRTAANGIAYSAIKELNRIGQCGEELRLLYVAMTRAQDKLIMFTKEPSESRAGNVLDPENVEATLKQTAPFKWVLDSLMRYYGDDGFDTSVCCKLGEITAGNKPEALQTDTGFYDITDDEVRLLAQRIGFSYKHSEDTIRRAKYSVTELAHINSLHRVTCGKPSFEKNGELTGAEIGTAYHKCMQFIPTDELRYAASSEYPDIVKRAISCTKALNDNEKRAVDPSKIVRFLTSELGQRMLKSSEIRREKRFFDKIDGENIGYGALGTIILQGVVDMYFVENGEIVVVDYKTDTIANFENERDNYEKQVKIYSTVLPIQTGLPVKEVYLYTFTNSEAYRIK